MSFPGVSPKRVESYLATLAPTTRQFVADHLLRLCLKSGVPGVCAETIPFLKTGAKNDATIRRALTTAAKQQADDRDLASEDTEHMVTDFLRLLVGFGVKSIDSETTKLIRAHTLRGVYKSPLELKRLCLAVQREGKAKLQ